MYSESNLKANDHECIYSTVSFSGISMYYTATPYAPTGNVLQRFHWCQTHGASMNPSNTCLHTQLAFL